RGGDGIHDEIAEGHFDIYARERRGVVAFALEFRRVVGRIGLDVQEETTTEIGGQGDRLRLAVLLPRIERAVVNEVSEGNIVGVADRVVGSEEDAVGPARRRAPYRSLIAYRPGNRGLRGAADEERRGPRERSHDQVGRLDGGHGDADMRRRRPPLAVLDG